MKCVLALVAALLTGCAARPPCVPVDFSDLRAGKTTRTQALKRHGEPAGYYGKGRILAYRIVRERPADKSCDKLWTGPVGESKASVILVFDAKDILHRHRVIPLRE